jgi:hypothetical protein
MNELTPRSALLALALVAVSIGCGESLPPAAEPDRAQAALRTALDAWKNGESPESLKTRNPAIYVSDTEWRNGAQLEQYEIESGQTAGLGWRCEVTLTVKNAQGGSRTHGASYRIDTDPQIVVVHEE